MQVENRQQKDWSAAEEDKENKNQLEETQPLTWEQQRQKDIEMFEEGIIYSQRYYDEHSEYRHVTLPKQLVQYIPPHYLMSEEEWRSLGLKQSQGWEHYMIHEPEPHILLFKRERDYQLKYPNGKPQPTTTSVQPDRKPQLPTINVQFKCHDGKAQSSIINALPKYPDGKQQPSIINAEFKYPDGKSQPSIVNVQPKYHDGKPQPSIANFQFKPQPSVTNIQFKYHNEKLQPSNSNVLR